MENYGIMDANELEKLLEEAEGELAAQVTELAGSNLENKIAKVLNTNLICEEVVLKEVEDKMRIWLSREVKKKPSEWLDGEYLYCRKAIGTSIMPVVCFMKIGKTEKCKGRVKQVQHEMISTTLWFWKLRVPLGLQFHYEKFLLKMREHMNPNWAENIKSLGFNGDKTGTEIAYVDEKLLRMWCHILWFFKTIVEAKMNHDMRGATADQKLKLSWKQQVIDDATMPKVKKLLHPISPTWNYVKQQYADPLFCKASSEFQDDLATMAHLFAAYPPMLIGKVEAAWFLRDCRYKEAQIEGFWKIIETVQERFGYPEL